MRCAARVLAAVLRASAEAMGCDALDRWVRLLVDDDPLASARFNLVGASWTIVMSSFDLGTNLRFFVRPNSLGGLSRMKPWCAVEVSDGLADLLQRATCHDDLSIKQVALVVGCIRRRPDWVCRFGRNRHLTGK